MPALHQSQLSRFLALVPLLASVSHGLQPRDVLGGTIGLGDLADQAYLVSVTVGNSTVALQLDTWRSDLLVISDACKTPACDAISGPRYTPSASFVDIYDDGPLLQPGTGSIEDTAEGRLGRDTVTVAGLTMSNQVIGVVDSTNASSPYNGAVGNLGLGSLSQVADDPNSDITNVTYDSLIGNMSDSGPLLSRLSQTSAIEQPMFSITLQRDTIDVSGTGQLTIGELPAGVDNASLTWVPVRLYDLTQDPDFPPPTPLYEKAYPVFWEVLIDAVFLDGEELPAPKGSTPGNVSALISTTNPFVNGSADVVSAILQKVSSSSGSKGLPTLPCATAHNLTFQIGGKPFPVDPRDFASSISAQAGSGAGTSRCVPNVGPTNDDVKTDRDLWTWVLGTPFLKGTLVAFYYGNLTHPSADPPRVGFLSRVPQNASALLADAVQHAQSAGGTFESTSQAAPTASSLITGVPTATIPGRTEPSSSGGHTAAPSANAASSSSLQVGVAHAFHSGWFHGPGGLAELLLMLALPSLICVL